MKAKFILALFIPFFYSCIETLPDEEFTITRKPYAGNEIRLDGYYTGEIVGKKDYYAYIFFYSNGIEFSFAYASDVEPNQITEIIESERKSKDSWGIFQVINSDIKVQRLRLDGGTFTIQYVLENGNYKIINDSTLIYTNTLGFICNCHFNKYSPKPDSTNIFIK